MTREDAWREGRLLARPSGGLAGTAPVGLRPLGAAARDGYLCVPATYREGSPRGPPLRPRRRRYRPGPRARLLPLRGRSRAHRRRRLLRRGLICALARDRQRRPLHPRAGVLTGVPRAAGAEGHAAVL